MYSFALRLEAESNTLLLARKNRNKNEPLVFEFDKMGGGNCRGICGGARADAGKNDTCRSSGGVEVAADEVSPLVPPPPSITSRHEQVTRRKYRKAHHFKTSYVGNVIAPRPFPQTGRTFSTYVAATLMSYTCERFDDTFTSPTYQCLDDLSRQILLAGMRYEVSSSLSMLAVTLKH